MTETKFIIFSLVYTLIAIVFTFKLGPDMVQGAEAFSAVKYEFENISEMSLELKKRYPIKKYRLGNETYDADSFPLKIAFDTSNQKYRYLIASLKMDTLPLNLTFDMYQNSDRLKNFLSVMDNAEIIDKNNLEKGLPKTFSKKQLTNVNSVKLVLERRGDFQNNNNYLEINGQKIQGYNIILRKAIGLILAYTVWGLSAICLLIIPIGAVSQFHSYKAKGTSLTLSNWSEGIQNFFGFFSGNKD